MNLARLLIVVPTMLLAGCGSSTISGSSLEVNVAFVAQANGGRISCEPVAFERRETGSWLPEVTLPEPGIDEIKWRADAISVFGADGTLLTVSTSVTTWHEGSRCGFTYGFDSGDIPVAPVRIEAINGDTWNIPAARVQTGSIRLNQFTQWQ